MGGIKTTGMDVFFECDINFFWPCDIETRAELPTGLETFLWKQMTNWLRQLMVVLALRLWDHSLLGWYCRQQFKKVNLLDTLSEVASQLSWIEITLFCVLMIWGWIRGDRDFGPGQRNLKRKKLYHVGNDARKCKLQICHGSKSMSGWYQEIIMVSWLETQLKCS